MESLGKPKVTIDELNAHIIQELKVKKWDSKKKLYRGLSWDTDNKKFLKEIAQAKQQHKKFGVHITEKYRITLPDLTSWSTNKKVAISFAKKGMYGIVLMYTPKQQDILVDISSIEDILNESEVVLFPNVYDCKIEELYLFENKVKKLDYLLDFNIETHLNQQVLEQNQRQALIHLMSDPRKALDNIQQVNKILQTSKLTYFFINLVMKLNSIDVLEAYRLFNFPQIYDNDIYAHYLITNYPVTRQHFIRLVENNQFNVIEKCKDQLSLIDLTGLQFSDTSVAMDNVLEGLGIFSRKKLKRDVYLN